MSEGAEENNKGTVNGDGATAVAEEGNQRSDESGQDTSGISSYSFLKSLNLDRVTSKAMDLTPDPKDDEPAEANEPEAGDNEEPVKDKKPSVDVSFDDDNREKEDYAKHMAEVKKLIAELKSGKRSDDDAGNQASSKPTAKDVNPYEGLADEQVDELEVYEYLESMNPDKYKGIADRAQKFFKEVNEYASRQDEYWNPDEDEHFQKKIMATKPQVPNKEYRAAEIAKYAEPVYKKREEEIRKENEELKRKLAEIEHKPEIEKGLTEFDSAFPDLGDDADVTDLERSIYKEFKTGIRPLAEEYMKLRRGITPIDPNNESHKILDQFIAERVDYFENKAPKDKRFRNGKMFVAPNDYERLKANGQADDYWTFSDKDVVKMLGNHSATLAKGKIESRIKELEKQGWARVGKKSGQKPDTSGQADDDKGDAGRKRDEAPVKGSSKPAPKGSSSSGSDDTGGLVFLKMLKNSSGN